MVKQFLAGRDHGEITFRNAIDDEHQLEPILFVLVQILFIGVPKNNVCTWLLDPPLRKSIVLLLLLLLSYNGPSASSLSYFSLF